MGTENFLSVTTMSLRDKDYKKKYIAYFKSKIYLSYCRNWFLIALSAAILQIVSCNITFAERLNYCGLIIPLDLLRPIDTDNVKVMIGSDERIIARANLEHWAVEKTILDPLRISRLSTKELSNFINECAQTETPLIASAALSEIFKRGEEKSFSPREFLELSPENKQILAAAIETGTWENSVREAKTPGQISLLSESLAELVVLDSLWVKTKALRLYYLLSEPIYLVLYERIQEELAAGNIKYISQLSTSLDAFSDDYSKNISLLKQATRLSLQIYKEPFDFDSFAIAIATLQQASSTKEGHQVQDLLYPSVSTKLVTEISLLLKKNKVEEATKLLALLPPDRSSPEISMLVSEILNGLSTQPGILIDEKIYVLLESFAKTDSSIASLYQHFLETQFLTLIHSSQLAETEKLLPYVLRVRADPSIRNDELRFQQSLEYQKQGMSAKSLEKISQMQTGMSFSQSMRRLCIRMLGNFTLIAVLFFVVFAALWCLLKTSLIPGIKAEFLSRSTTFLKTSRSSAKSEKTKTKRKDLDLSDNVRPESSAFVRLDRMRGTSAIQVAYEKNLNQFGLSNKASLKELKTAYRSAVKECHPDLNPGQDKDQTQRFTDLTKMYEELLDLRRQLGIVD